MAGQVFTSSVIRQLKIRKVVETIGKEILYSCIIACCEETFEDISEQCREGKIERKHPTGKVIKEKLYNEDIRKATSDPTGLSFDITFLSKILLLVEADHPTLYEKVKRIKDTRNEIFHNDSPLEKREYEQKLSQFETLFLETLQEAERVASLQTLKLGSQRNRAGISDGISRIQTLKAQLGFMIHKIKCESIDESKTDVLEYLRVDGQREIDKAYESLIYANPVEFFVGTKYKILVSDFYTDLEFYDNDEDKSIPHENVLQMAAESTFNCVIEGVAGIGKTTFVRRIMVSKRDLSRSSFLIHFDCRNDSFSSLKDLLSNLMPNASGIFSQDRLLSSILALSVSFVVDGLDELNENSDRVLKEIIDIVKRRHATFFVTSRPEGIKKFLGRISGIEYRYLEIRGIHMEKQDKLVENYMRIFSPSFKTNPSPSLDQVLKTFNDVKSTFREYIRIPLIICLLVYLIMNDRSIDRNKTLSSVYLAIFEALLAKLKGRISLSMDLSDLEVEDKVDEYFSFLCTLSFKTLKMNEIILKQDTSSKIARKIKELFGHIREDVLSSLFVCRGYLTPTGHQRTSYSYPHKSFQEFLAAKELERLIREKKTARLWELVGPRILGNKNLLVFTIGIMTLNYSFRKEICDEIADFVMKSKNLGDFDSNLTLKMLDILRESNTHPEMTGALARHLRKLSLDQRDDDLNLFQKIFEEECPNLTHVKLIFVLQTSEPSALIEKMLTSIKMKNVELNLDFLNSEGQITPHLCDCYVEILHEGRCKLGTFFGCLSEAGVNCLPDNLKKLTLYIGGEREANGFQRLNELLIGNIDRQLDHNGKITVHWLEIIISCQVCTDSLPPNLKVIKGVVLLKLRDINAGDDYKWALNVAKRILPKQRIVSSSHMVAGTISRMLPIMSVLNLHCSFLFEECQQLIQSLQEGDIYLTKFQIDSVEPLTETQNEQMRVLCKERLSCTFASRFQLLARNMAARLGEEGVRELPNEMVKLELILKNENDIKGLNCLIERMKVAKEAKKDNEAPDIVDSNQTRGIFIQTLKLLISRRCDAYLFPKKLPIPSEKLEISFGGVEKDDIPWVLQVMERLPKLSDQQCKKIEIWLLNFHFREEGTQFFEFLLNNSFQPMVIHMASSLNHIQMAILPLLQNKGLHFSFY